ncbi:MAG: DinB family protein [Gemmatimonadetes bacterium]|nr:DinB family protein [Gemmatimonadota bacterium]MBT6149462.1 DinB family protein [Gemmatimonadota bacterium]MBT7864022.1 DinB family protein [Gemmatimonadota bacterium]
MSDPQHSALGDGIHRQLGATWKQWRKAIEQIPPDHWRTGDIDYLIPARHALHVINTVHGYCRHEQAESWNGLTDEFFGRSLDWEGTAADELPDQTQCLAYLEHVGDLTRAWLDGLSDEEILSPQEAFPWTGPNLLSRMIYVIRHSQDHSGQLNAELRRRDLPRSAWET